MVQKQPLRQIYTFLPLLFIGLFCAWPYSVQAAGPLDTWHVRVGNTFTKGIAYGTGLYVAGGPAQPDAAMFVSEDGVTWTVLTAFDYGMAFPYDILALTYGKGFVAVGQNGHILALSNSHTWAQATAAVSGTLTAVTYGGGVYVAVSDGGSIVTSVDGMNWVPRLSGTTAPLTCVAYGDGVFTAAGAAGTILTSSDGGLTWLSRMSARAGETEPGDFLGIAYGGGTFVLVGLSGEIETSPNGEAWTSQPLSDYADLFGIAYGSGFFTAVGGNGIDNTGVVLTSPDGVTWTSRTTITDTLAAVTYGKGDFVALSFEGTILQSDPLPSAAYLLTVNKIGSGNVQAFPAGIDCGLQCAASYEPGTVVTLTATPAQNFLRWSGRGCTGDAATCTVTLDAHATVTAEFSPAGAPIGRLTINDGAAYTRTQFVVLYLYPTVPGSVARVQFSNDAAQWREPENFDPTHPTKDWTLTAAEGRKSVYAKFQDNAGIWSDVYPATIILDTVPPETAVQPPGGIYQGIIPVTMTTSEAARIYFTTDGTAPAVTSAFYIGPLLIKADTTVKYSALDPAGNVEPVRSAVYRIVSAGDIDNSGGVDLRDAILCLRFLIGENPLDEQFRYATSGVDPDGDGKISMGDVIYILQKIAGMR